MARTRPAGRLDEIVDAARRTFQAKGYRRARMDEIAAAAGVSPGLLYTYAAGKEALFALAVQRELGVDLSTADLPVPNPSFDETQHLIAGALLDLGHLPALDGARAVTRPADPRSELTAIVGEHYDKVHQYRRFIRLVERSALDWPRLAARWYDHSRTPFVERLGAYIAQRVDIGAFTPVPDPGVAARFIVETVAWFANHRYGDHDGAQIDDAIARATVVELVSAGLVGRMQ